MKKTVSIILVCAFLLGLSACGGGETTVPTEENVSVEQPDESVLEPTAAPVFEGTELDTEFWTITYSDDWSYIEDDLVESEGYYSYITLDIMDGEESLVSVYIDATLEGPSNYRDDLKSAGIDAYELVENQSVSLVSVGGVDCVTNEGEYWGDPMFAYYGRNEGAGATVIVRIIGEVDDPRVTGLLDSLTFKLTDDGNIDPPWPWNGEPFSTETPVSKMVGTNTITSQWLPIDTSLVVDDIFSGRVAVAGEKIYVLLDNQLTQYAFDGSSLTFEKDIPLDQEYEEISADNDGVLYLSGFMSDFIGIQDGTKIFSFSGPDYVTMHPSGEWGISFFVGPDVEKVTLSDGTMTTEEWNFEEVDTISSISISDNYIFVSGYSVETENQAIFVYDLTGNLQLTLGGTEFGEPDSLGSITATMETMNGFIGVDGNMRDLYFWKLDGTFIGTLSDGDLFGTWYPWMSTAVMMPDGSILIGMTEERADESADEFIVFSLTGF